MIIDGHAHACGDYLTPESIIKNLNENHVDKVLLSPGELNSHKIYPIPNIAELFPKQNVVKFLNATTKLVTQLTGAVNGIPPGNDYVYNLSTKCPGRVLQCIWITSLIPDPLSYLSQKMNAWHFKCVKIHQGWENISVDSPFFKNMAEWTETNDLPLFIHPLSDSEVLKLIEYKKKHQNLKLIIAHLFGVEQFIKNGFKDNNLYFDISSLQYTSTFRLFKAIRFFGAEKIFLGSDTPYGKDNLKKNIERIYSLNISNSDKELILGKNLNRLLLL